MCSQNLRSLIEVSPLIDFLETVLTNLCIEKEFKLTFHAVFLLKSYVKCTLLTADLYNRATDM